MFNMFFALLLKMLATESLALNSKMTHYRIYNDSAATDGQFPYVVLIYANNGSRIDYCTGTLIQLDIVLTVAHCIEFITDPTDIIVLGGAVDTRNYEKVRFKTPWQDNVHYPSYTVQERRASQIKFHPTHQKPAAIGIAALIMALPFTYTNYVQKIKVSLDAIKIGSNCTQPGYGVTNAYSKDRILAYTVTNKVQADHKKCNRKRQVGFFYCVVITDGSMCYGDEGGPLVCKGKVRAIAQGIEYSNKKNPICGSTGIEWYVDLRAEKKYPFLIPLLKEPPEKSFVPKPQFYFPFLHLQTLFILNVYF